MSDVAIDLGMEVAESEPTSATEEVQPAAETKEEDEGPSPEKRRKIDESGHEKLEFRLGGILCCAVCLDLPPAAVYQCTNGHLMCAACFTHLLADARLRDEAATCPNCRVEISKNSASRNLAVEKTVSELPSDCKYCAGVFPRHALQHHEEKKCDERSYKLSQIVVCSKRPNAGLLEGLVRIASTVYWLFMSVLRRSYLVSETADSGQKKRRYRRLTGCRYACIGCPWRGPHHELASHESACVHPHKSAADVVDTMRARDVKHNEQLQVFHHLMDLLSFEKITFNDIQLKPYRTDEFIQKLYYESSRFAAFGHQWVVKAFVNKNQRDPTQSYDRDLTYQLILKTKSVVDLQIQWVSVRGPYGEARVLPRVETHVFSENATDTTPALLALADPSDTNRLLSNKAIHFSHVVLTTNPLVEYWPPPCAGEGLEHTSPRCSNADWWSSHAVG